jgi:hypothetical protein
MMGEHDDDGESFDDESFSADTDEMASSMATPESVADIDMIDETSTCASTASLHPPTPDDYATSQSTGNSTAADDISKRSGDLALPSKSWAELADAFKLMAIPGPGDGHCLFTALLYALGGNGSAPSSTNSTERVAAIHEIKNSMYLFLQKNPKYLQLYKADYTEAVKKGLVDKLKTNLLLFTKELFRVRIETPIGTMLPREAWGTYADVQLV